MNKKSNDLLKLLPPELEEAKELINKLIEYKPQQRLTNLEKNKIINCPDGGSSHRIKKNGTQKWYAKILVPRLSKKFFHN